MPALPPGGVLLRVLDLSLDAGALVPIGVGDVIPGESVSEVIASEHSAYAAGDFVLSSTGWRTHVASDGAGLRKVDSAFGPVRTALGVLGTPGFVAYSGIMQIGKPKPGETVVVAAAGDPVGSLVGQLAKMAGARVVGIAGGTEECHYIREELEFEGVIDHRMPDLADTLAAVCPNGIDIYFENVGGGPIWHAVLPLLNRYARVPVRGWATQYTGAGAADGLTGPIDTLREVASKRLTLRGFVSDEFTDMQYREFLRIVSQGIANGRIRHREDVTNGLENAPLAFIKMLEGRSFGKALVCVAPTSLGPPAA